MTSKFDERLAVLESTFATLYYGHLDPVQQSWHDLERQIIELCGEVIVDYSKCFAGFASCLAKHPASKFPVSPMHLHRVQKWIATVSPPDACLPKLFASQENVEPNMELKYVFKTHDLSGILVTLLEENRDPLGQGTTGLISWQGAVMLQAWADTFGHDILQGENNANSVWF